METPRSCSSSSCLLMVVLALAHWCSIATASCSFTVSNYCSQPIWPGTLAGAGTPQLPTTGFRLDPGQTVQVPAPTGWSGRLWARTGCAFDAGGNGTCQTGDCGGRLECAGTGATPPVTLFEVTLGKAAGDLDYYDVSLVDGYNLPVVAVPRPRQGAGGCNATGCTADLNRSCPRELQVDRGGGTVACRSACEAFGQDQYCCSGAYATPTTCRPTAYSSAFKSACPRAYSYAYDDGSSTFTCGSAADYTIAFCLPPSGLQSPGAVPLGSPPPAYGQSTSGGTSGAAGSTPPPAIGNNGVGSISPPPPTTDNNGVGSTNPPPDNNGVGSTNQPPASTDNNGFGSTDQPSPAATYGAGSTDQPPWMMLSSASMLHEQLSLVLPAVLLFLLWSFSP
ncbi:hypothetical protein SETIT_6G214000v2 [Setaria italica]|uniref:Pathogenesis-related protein 5 n=1 Tax=Setaria italica TaxID=4555 RepID=K3YLN1_SETIT|nr:thaumatin-like protein 1b [Setaria italica]RCV31888.1 hypothetical protein SETIT_6G214000v2 [Setaria italica]